MGAGLWVSGGGGRSCSRLAVVDLQSRFVVATLLCAWRIGGAVHWHATGSSDTVSVMLILF